MNVELLRKLSDCEFGKHFLTRSYSIELMLVLLENSFVDGIDDLYHSLCCSVPKQPAFLHYLDYLESKNCIKKSPSPTKRNKKLVSLTDDCKAAIQKHFSKCSSPTKNTKA